MDNQNKDGDPDSRELYGLKVVNTVFIRFYYFKAFLL